MTVVFESSPNELQTTEFDLKLDMILKIFHLLGLDPYFECQFVLPDYGWATRLEVKETETWIHGIFDNFTDVHRFDHASNMQREEDICQTFLDYIFELLLSH